MKDSGVEWIGKIPEKWDVRPFKNMTSIIMGQSPKSDEIKQTGETLFMQGNKEFREIYPSPTTYCETPSKKSRVGDILMSVRAPVGALNISDKEYGIGRGLCSIKGIGINREFLLYFLRKSVDDFEILSNGTTFSAITVDTLKNVKIVIPSLKEQQQIANFLNHKTHEINSIIGDTKQSIVELKKYKQAVITETVSRGLNPDVKMKDSGVEWIGEVPEHWNVSRLRYLGTLQNGISKSGDAFGSGFPFLSYGDVYRDIELPKTVSGLIESSESDRLNYSVTYGDVLFTRTSETIEEVGFSSTCLETIPDVVFAGFVIRFRPTTDELFPRFSKYYFRSQIHRSFFAKEMNLVIRASLSQQLLKKLPVLLPSIEEQQQIADYLDEKCAHIDSLIADKEKLIGEFETYRKALIFEYVTGKKEVE
jgi:type I restriction enzyme S subunit